MENFMRCVDLFNKYFGEEFTVVFVDAWDADAHKYIVRVTENATGFSFQYVCGGCTLTLCDVRAACEAEKKNIPELIAYALDFCKSRGATRKQLATLREKLTRELLPTM